MLRAAIVVGLLGSVQSQFPSLTAHAHAHAHAAGTAAPSPSPAQPAPNSAGESWVLTADSSEAYRATYVLLISAILLPIVLFARRCCMVVALVLLVVSIVHQVSSLDVDTSYWGHIAAGVGLCRASHYILHGDGGALVIRVQHAMLGLVATLAMFSFVVFRLPLETFYNKVHIHCLLGPRPSRG